MHRPNGLNLSRCSLHTRVADRGRREAAAVEIVTRYGARLFSVDAMHLSAPATARPGMPPIRDCPRRAVAIVR